MKSLFVPIVLFVTDVVYAQEDTENRPSTQTKTIAIIAALLLLICTLIALYINRNSKDDKKNQPLSNVLHDSFALTTNGTYIVDVETPETGNNREKINAICK